MPIENAPGLLSKTSQPQKHNDAVSRYIPISESLKHSFRIN